MATRHANGAGTTHVRRDGEHEPERAGGSTDAVGPERVAAHAQHRGLDAHAQHGADGEHGTEGGVRGEDGV